MNMRLGDIDNFNLLELCAENTERTKQMKNVTLTENEKELISEWISDCKTLASASKLTGFSENYLSSLKNKHRDKVRGSTYEVFEKILNPEPSPNAEKEAQEKAKEIEGPNEFEIMAQMDFLFSSLPENARHRVLAYFESKYVLSTLDEVLDVGD